MHENAFVLPTATQNDLKYLQKTNKSFYFKHVQLVGKDSILYHLHSSFKSAAI